MSSDSSDDTSFLRRRTRELVDGTDSVAPLRYEALRRQAESTLEDPDQKYIAAEAGRGDSKRANREGFDRWKIVPRVLRDVSSRDTSVKLFGDELPAPALLAPIGGLRRYHEEGELAVARAARTVGVPLTLSTWSSTPLEDVANSLGKTPRLFQLYWVNDWDVTASLVRRAEAAGYSGIVLTVDSKLPTWRTQTLKRGRTPSTPPANFTSDPVVQEQFGTDDDLSMLVKTEPATAYDATLSWDDLSFLRERTDLPLIVKGVLHPADAIQAIETGVDGIVVSTHGGRQLDGCLGAIEALPHIVSAVDGRVPVLFDSGVRCGADAFKALALGATAVFLGRPYVYGLALAGEQGVYEVVANLLAELESILGLSGYTSIAAVDSAAVVETNRLHCRRTGSDGDGAFR